MARNLARLRHAVRSAPPQMRLVALVLIAAIVSGIVAKIRGTAETEAFPAADSPPPAAAPVAEEPSPSLPVEAAMEAARKGDLESYLAQFADPLQSQLTRLRAEKGDAYLQDYLGRLTRPIKGIAADLTRQEAVGPDTIRLAVQFIYADRNEVQSFTLCRDGERWRIRGIDAVRSAPTFVPYGTPIQQIESAPRAGPPPADPQRRR